LPATKRPRGDMASVYGRGVRRAIGAPPMLQALSALPARAVSPPPEQSRHIDPIRTFLLFHGHKMFITSILRSRSGVNQRLDVRRVGRLDAAQPRPRASARRRSECAGHAGRAHRSGSNRAPTGHALLRDMAVDRSVTTASRRNRHRNAGPRRLVGKLDVTRVPWITARSPSRRSARRRRPSRRPRCRRTGNPHR
jgi:hypothetical protein